MSNTDSTTPPEQSAVPSDPAMGSAAAEISELEAALAAKQKQYVRAWQHIGKLQEQIRQLKEKRGIDFDETATFLIESAENRLIAAKILISEKHGGPPNS